MNADVIGEISRAIKEKERVSKEKITPAQKSELIQLVVGKTAAETQRDLALALDIEIKRFETKRVQKDNSVRLEIGVSEEIYANLMKCRDHASHKIQQEHLPHTLESLLKVLTESYIKNNKLNEAAEVEGVEETKDQGPTNLKTFVPIKKTITPKTRREVFARDKCCQFKNPITGEVCGSKFMPQVDHKMPLWAGGTNDFENLQQLCANHNQRKYRKESQLSWLQ